MTAPRVPRTSWPFETTADDQNDRHAAHAATDVGADDEPMPTWGRWAWAGYFLTFAIALGAIYVRFF